MTNNVQPPDAAATHAMTTPSTPPNPDARPRATARRFAALAGLGLLVLSPGLGAAPPFVLDGRVPQLRGKIVALDAGRPVTAFDVLIYLDLTRNPVAAIPVDQWLADPAKRDPALGRQIEAGIEQYLAVMSLARQGSAPVTPGFVRRSLLSGAAAAVWSEVAVSPQIRIEDADVQRYYIAHPQRYFDAGRAQVRYIFLGVPEDENLDERLDEATSSLSAIRSRIAAGELRFDEAARTRSEAPSAAEGGLIPEFEPGTWFAAFEAAAFALENPGDLSQVFAGNGGVYLLQLLSKTPPSRTPLDPGLDASIREILSHEHVEPYYRLAYNALSAEAFIQNNAALWSYAGLETPIAIVNQAELPRDRFLQMFPGAIDDRFELDWTVIMGETGRWIESELLMTDLEARGQLNHPYLIDAGRVIDAWAAARETLRRRVNRAAVTSTEAAMQALGKRPGDAPGLPQSRLVRFEFRIAPRAVGDAARVSDAWDLMGVLAGKLERGEAPIEAVTFEFMDPLAQAAARGEDAMAAELDLLREYLGLDAVDDVTIRIRDLGWVDALREIGEGGGVAGVEAGQFGEVDLLDDGRDFTLVAATRTSMQSPWLEVPARLKAAVFDFEMERLMAGEIERLRSLGELNVIGSRSEDGR